MSATVATLLGSAGAVAAPLAALVPLLLAQGRRVDRFEARVVARFEALTADVGEVRRATCTPWRSAWPASKVP